MIRTMRLGAFALTAVSTLALGVAFTGCGSSDDAPGDSDTGTPVVDTGTPDTTKTDTGTPPGDTSVPTDTAEGGTDTAPPPADRQVTMIFAQPDNPATGLYVCLGGFTGTADPATIDAPSAAVGPAGIPNDPKDLTKGFKSGFTYGSAFPFPVNDVKAQVALKSLTVVAYFVETKPADCAAAWKDVKGDTKRWFKVDAGTINKGESWGLLLDGCKTPATTNAALPGICGDATATTDNRTFTLKKLDISKTAPTAGFEVQLWHASQFPGVTGALPSFQNIDVYIQPMKAGTTADAGPGDTGDAGDADADAIADAAETAPPKDEAAGLPIKIAGGIKDLDLGALTDVAAVAGDPTKALFVIQPAGSAYCLGTAGCPAVPVPAAPYLAGYKPLGGGFSGNQLFFITGSPRPPTGSTDPTKAPLFFGMTNIKQF